MTIINVMVDDQRLEFSSMPVVASEGVQETYVKFALSSDWSGFGAVALFYRDDDPTVYESPVDGTGLAEVPYEITAAPGWIRFGLSGSNGTAVHTSEILKYKIVKGLYTSGQGSEPPAPGIYEQMLAIAGQMRNTFNATIVVQNEIIQGLVSDMDDLRSDMETEQTTFENVVTGQINTLVNNFAGSSRETVLFSGSHQVNVGNEIDLVSSPTVYDYLDIVLNDGLIGTIIGPTQNSHWRVTGETIKSTGASVTTYVVEGVLDGNTLRVTEAAAIVDIGTASTRYDLEDGPLADESLRRYCLKVIGRKLTDDAEVLNIRVGADGVTYQTAGTAVRTQLDKKLNAPISGGTVDYGTSGQLLATDGQGNTEWVNSTIPDGSITVSKLAPGVIDTTYQIPGAAASSVTVGQSLASKADADDLDALDTRVTALESGSGGGLTADIKSALLACFANVAWANENGQTYYDALDAALNPPANLSSITCVYTQSGTVYDTASLDDLKTDLVVTAHWSDNTTSTVTTYTLSGTLTEGTSTITVSYGGKTTTFSVTVSVFSTAPVILATDTQWKSDYTQGAKTGLCITDYYTCDVDYDALKATSHYDSTNDYMTTVGDIYKIVTHFPNSQSIAFSGHGKSMVFFDMSGEEKHASASCLAYEDNQFASSRQNSNYMHADDGHFKFSFTLGSADVNDSYAYWDATTSGVMPIGVMVGDIIFAGRNTPYWGCSNISEASS